MSKENIATKAEVADMLAELFELPEKTTADWAERLRTANPMQDIATAERIQLFANSCVSHDPYFIEELTASELALLLDYLWEQAHPNGSFAIAGCLPVESETGTYIAEMECNSCGRKFFVRYNASDKNFGYIEEPCACESDFSETDPFLSIGEWLELRDAVASRRKLSYSVRTARFLPKDVFRLHHHTPGAKVPAGRQYGVVDKEVQNASNERIAVEVEVVDKNLYEEASAIRKYVGGDFHFVFTKRLSCDCWLVSVKADKIIGSHYALISDEEMSELAAGV